ncbi:dethiobiotin synthase [uncultured Capnocytophaga sp.]|uniref:dethiobiotin synthase n=1 Tax=uncultured Capnocytophaga sp. TaxID=159273 RepID=UPI00261EE403|nr:dethiobiotin synthase [uncultured Capnocytophaga sp.]
MKDTYFVVGISTEVGKTIVSAILTEAFQADYWKPIQSGDLENSDTDKVKRLISSTHTVFHLNSYGLHTPASPHLSAQLDGVRIELSKIVRPETNNTLVIEAAGGLYVPLNEKDMMLDLIHPTDKVILVSRHYLGSINHTLLTYETLKNRGLNIHSIVFSGTPTPSTEEVILRHTNLPVLLHIDEEPYFDKQIILKYATKVNK